MYDDDLSCRKIIFNLTRNTTMNKNKRNYLAIRNSISQVLGTR